MVRLVSLVMCCRCLISHGGKGRRGCAGVDCVSTAAALQAAGKVVDQMRQDGRQPWNDVDIDGREIASDLGYTRREPGFVA